MKNLIPTLTANIVVAALQSGKTPSYEAKDVAAYYDMICNQIIASCQRVSDALDPNSKKY